MRQLLRQIPNWEHVITVPLAILAAVMIITLAGCKTAPLHPVVSPLQKMVDDDAPANTDPVVMVPLEQTGARKDIPADVKPSEVVAQIETQSGAKLWVVKKPKQAVFAKQEYTVYRNEQAIQENITAERPKRSVWERVRWIAYIIAVLVAMALLSRIKAIVEWAAKLFELVTRWRRKPS